MQENTPKIVYPFKEALYINLTNRCPNSCKFCIKNKFTMFFEGFNLNLEGREPSAQEVVAEIEKGLKLKTIKEVVFCGYGEPTMRLAVLLEVSRLLRQKMAEGKMPRFTIRLNTVGLGNLANGRDITGDLASAIDEINISLNTPDEQEWVSVVRPLPEYKEQGFKSVLEFIELMAQKMPSVIVSIVDKQGIDVEKTKKLVESLGAKLYVRAFIDDKK